MALDDNISALATAIGTKVKNKQDLLVSGASIKTINNQSILGSGNITISGAGGVQNVFIQELEPTIDVGTSALWIQKSLDGSITFNLVEN
jgi:hypothetical protein